MTCCFRYSTIDHTHKACSSSTNSELIDAVTSGQLPAHIPHLYTADSQSGGRGQHGRSWLSPVGNVYLSLYVPVDTAHLHCLTGALSLCVGLALWQMPIITAINHKRQNNHLPPIMVKWANDLGFYEETGLFYKLAGILIEPVIKGHLVGVVIGVGLNLNVAPTITDGLYHATSLCALDPDSPTNPHHLYAPLCEALGCAIDWHNAKPRPQGFGIQLSHEFIDRFNHAHALHGKPVAIYPKNERTISHRGICSGIDSNGALLLDGVAVFDGMAVRIL